MKNTISLFRRYHSNKDGSTAVEFGLIAGVFMMILFGIIETARLFLTWNTFQFAFENASRAALVDSSLTTQQIEALITDEMNDFMVSTAGVDIDVSFTSASGIQFVEIDGTYDFDMIVPMLPESWEAIQMKAHSRLPRQ